MTSFYYQIGEQHNKYFNPFLKSQQNKNGQNLYATKPEQLNNVKPEGFMNAIEALDKAVPNEALVSSKNTSNGQKSLSDSEQKSLMIKISNKINRYKFAAIQGSTRAITMLDNMRSGSGEDIEKLSGSHALEISSKAGRIFQGLMDNLEYTPKLLKALMQMSEQDSKNPASPQQSKMASAQLTKLINEGKLDIEKAVKPLLKQNPKTVLKALDGLSKSNIPRESRQQIASIMSDFAKTHGTSEAGDIATKNLHNMIRQEGQNGVLDQAFQGLKDSALNGNDTAVFSLEKIANENLSSTNKASKSIKALATIAKEKPNDAIGDLAVKSLRKTATKQAGNSTGLLAKTALREVANDDNNKMNKQPHLFAQNKTQNEQSENKKFPYQTTVA